MLTRCCARQSTYCLWRSGYEGCSIAFRGLSIRALLAQSGWQASCVLQPTVSVLAVDAAMIWFAFGLIWNIRHVNDQSIGHSVSFTILTRDEILSSSQPRRQSRVLFFAGRRLIEEELRIGVLKPVEQGVLPIASCIVSGKRA